MPKSIEGYIIKYGQPSLPLPMANGASVYEVVQQDAFYDSVNDINAGVRTIEANVEHEDNAITRIGLSGKNVQVENRPEGVYATIALLGDSLSTDIFIKAQAGIVTGFSVEFDPEPVNAEPQYSMIGGDYVRRWDKLRLFGFAVCTMPCYPDAQIVKAGNVDLSTIKRSIIAAQQAEGRKLLKRADRIIAVRGGGVRI